MCQHTCSWQGEVQQTASELNTPSIFLITLVGFLKAYYIFLKEPLYIAITNIYGNYK
jgi:hypothetical protein